MIFKIKEIHFSVKNLKMKKEQKIFDLPEPGFELQIFNNFLAHDLNYHAPMIWIIMESEEPKIKSKQASKRYMT